MTRQHALMTAAAVEGSMSVWAALIFAQSAGWPTTTLAIVLGIMTTARFFRLAWQVMSASPEHLRRTAMSTSVGLLGWLALIVLFGLRLLYPDLDLPMSWYVAAFATHILGVVGALISLRGGDDAA